MLPSGYYLIDSFNSDKIVERGEPVYKKNKLDKYGYIISPVFVERNHWCILCVDIKQATVIYCDPRVATIDRKQLVLDNWQKFCASRKDIQTSGWRLGEFKHSKQFDGFNCGVIILKIAEAFIAGNSFFNFDKTVLASARKYFYNKIIKISPRHVLKSTYCSVCDVPLNKEDKIECYCSRNFHKNCFAQNSVADKCTICFNN